MESYRITADEARRRLEEGNLEYVYTNRFMCDTSLDHLKKVQRKRPAAICDHHNLF